MFVSGNRLSRRDADTEERKIRRDRNLLNDSKLPFYYQPPTFQMNLPESSDTSVGVYHRVVAKLLTEAVDVFES
jgi:hypothetical protein